MKKTSVQTEYSIPKKHREVEILMRISQSIIGTLHYQEVLQIISDGMAELLDIESAAIYLLQADDYLYLGATTPALPPDMPEAFRKAPLSDHPHINRAIDSRQPQIIEDSRTAELSPAEKDIMESRQLRSLLFFPFVQKKTVLGVLILGTCQRTKKYTKHQVEFGQTVANQLSVSIHNTLLHDTLKKHRDNLELMVQEKTRKLDATIEELQAANENLYHKNDIINQQNIELRKTLKQLQEAQSQLIQAEKMASLGTLTAGVAHEINNPLNFLSGVCMGLENFIEETNTENNQEVMVLLDGMQTGIERISGIVQGLNQFSRQNTHSDEDCDIHTIIDNCLAMLNPNINDQVILEKRYFDHPIIIQGNVGKLHQVCMNVILNSIQAIEGNGKITINTNIKNNRNLVIEVVDNGIGINKENLDKITDPFFTTKAPGKGTGLGLSIAYNIIKEHNGRLEFESEPGKGTTTRIVIPYKPN